MSERQSFIQNYKDGSGGKSKRNRDRKGRSDEDGDSAGNKGDRRRGGKNRKFVFETVHEEIMSNKSQNEEESSDSSSSSVAVGRKRKRHDSDSED